MDNALSRPSGPKAASERPLSACSGPLFRFFLVFVLPSFAASRFFFPLLRAPFCYLPFFFEEAFVIGSACCLAALLLVVAPFGMQKMHVHTSLLKVILF